MSQVDAQDSAPLTFRQRASTSLQLSVPTDVLAELAHVAHYRDMSVDALLKLYIGQALRQDIAKLFSERVLDLTAEVLTRHGQSPEQVETILRELRSAASI